MPEFRLETPRLVLRDWREADVDPFHALCNDPEVMRHLGPPQAREAVVDAIGRMRGFQAAVGCSFWALERLEDGAFLGFCGLKPGPGGTPLAGKTEIGWRLARHAWGQGYAREAAAASLGWGFANLPAAAIMAMTVSANTRSWGLMERLGMKREAGLDFDHPALAEGDPLRPHIVYSITRTGWNHGESYAS